MAIVKKMSSGSSGSGRLILSYDDGSQRGAVSDDFEIVGGRVNHLRPGTDTHVKYSVDEMKALRALLGQALAVLPFQDETFDVGDVVEFKNGMSPPMTVESVDDESANVVWFDDDDQCNEASFPKALLRVVGLDEEE